MTSVKLTYRLVFIVMLLSLLLLCACQSQKQKSASSGVPRTSSLQVKIEADGIRLQSTIAEFF